jgi:hypothetical protein
MLERPLETDPRHVRSGEQREIALLAVVHTRNYSPTTVRLTRPAASVDIGYRP